jgi:hypothetical protein
MIERARDAGSDLEYEHRLQLRDHSCVVKRIAPNVSTH